MNRNSHGQNSGSQTPSKYGGHDTKQRMSASDASKYGGVTEPPEGPSGLRSGGAPSQLVSRLRSGLRPTTYLSVLRLSNLSQLLLDDDTERLFHRVGYGVMLVGALVAAGATGLNLPLVQWLEWEARTLFFQRRGTVIPPSEIVILAMDEASLGQGEFYTAAPEDYPFLAPIAQWPWQRAAYGLAIERLMQAGAKAVVVDLVLDLPSTWGEADDLALQHTLERYPGQVVLASHFEDVADEVGGTLKFLRPLPQFTEAGARIGNINYPIEANGRVHQFSQVWLHQNKANDPIMQAYLEMLPPEFQQSLDRQTWQAVHGAEGEAAVNGEGIPRPMGQNDGDPGNLDIGNQIFFYGPAQTFDRQSFWTVLDPQSWQNYRQRQTFDNKVVIIGPTASLFNDFHRTPYGLMPGVEIHANAIANYLENRAIADAIPHPYGRALLVFGLTVAAGTAIGAPRRMIHRGAITAGVLVIWTCASYGLWVWWGLVVPTAIPLGAIAFVGIGYIVSGLVRGKLKLRGLLRRYVSSPIVQDIISRQDDLQDLIAEEERATLGKKLQGRYEIVKILGSGGFGQTFTARDLSRPGQPICVVKQLQPVTNDPKVFQLSQRLFQREAETLERLGSQHKQIPQLLAYFEEAQEFYLVQELIEGRPLNHELRIRQPFSNRDLIILLKELLEILGFIHSCGVIHRDIKPSNVIRRHSDQKLVLIDFGAVKEIQGSAPDNLAGQTVSIGTRGYMPNEQLAGNPQFNSDIYAVGIIGIQASTKLSPEQLRDNVKTGELVWQHCSNHSPELKAILHKMTRYDFRQRYQSALDVLKDLQGLLALESPHEKDSSIASATTVGNEKQDIPEVLLGMSNDLDSGFDDDDERYVIPTMPWPTDLNGGAMEDNLDEDTGAYDTPTLSWLPDDGVLLPEEGENGGENVDDEK
ncbi:MAG: serine/threonine-protein kinase [Leptolyngbyaceae bacterium]|nr:serine/threonine-protein kinase [Leptolyngbyaceae bacterium]